MKIFFIFSILLLSATLQSSHWAERCGYLSSKCLRGLLIKSAMNQLKQAERKWGQELFVSPEHSTKRTLCCYFSKEAQSNYWRIKLRSHKNVWNPRLFSSTKKDK